MLLLFSKYKMEERQQTNFTSIAEVSDFGCSIELEGHLQAAKVRNVDQFDKQLITKNKKSHSLTHLNVSMNNIKTMQIF